MNLLTFTLKTSKLLLFVAGVFVFGAALSAWNGYGAAYSLAVLFAGTTILMFAMVKTAQHRRTLDRLNVKAYVRFLIRNRDNYPNALVTDLDAAAKINELFDNPIQP